MAWLSTPTAEHNPGSDPTPNNRDVLGRESWKDTCWWFGHHLERTHAITRVVFKSMTYAAAVAYQAAWPVGTTVSGTAKVTESRADKQNEAGAYQVHVTWDDPGAWSSV